MVENTDTEIELTIRVGEKEEGFGETPMDDTIEAVKACLNGSRSSGYFVNYDVVDAEYVDGG